MTAKDSINMQINSGTVRFYNLNEQTPIQKNAYKQA